jgi:DNA recombination protein RmuC
MAISSLILFIAALLLGALLGWLMGKQRGAAALSSEEALLGQARAALGKAEAELSAERQAAASAQRLAAGLQARLEAEQNASAEKLALLTAFDANVKESFESLAANALDANARRLIEMSQAELNKQKLEAGKELEAKESSIANMLAPMRESLERLNMHSQHLEVQRQGAYQKILSEVENIQRSHSDLRSETKQLVQALRAPKVRGNWGEMQLRRCVEHAGMVEYASFEVEKFVRGEDGSVRPDLIVRLPNQRCIVVDAKTPLDAFLNAGACEDETQRQVWLTGHAAAVRKHLDALAGKAYWNRFRESPDFVVCFLPSEVLFSAALEQDPTLLEHSAHTKVLLATPTTLIALLKAVAYGWQQAAITRDAELIKEHARKLYEKFLGMHTSLISLGTNLRRAGDCFDDVVNKAEGHGGLFSIARKLRELNIGEKDLAESKPVAMRPRALSHDDWPQAGLALVASADEDKAADAAL